ncbi:MAG: hypothetical protein ACEPOW_05395 [Bacteroidales bacterium]
MNKLKTTTTIKEFKESISNPIKVYISYCLILALATQYIYAPEFDHYTRIFDKNSLDYSPPLILFYILAYMVIHMFYKERLKKISATDIFTKLNIYRQYRYKHDMIVFSLITINVILLANTGVAMLCYTFLIPGLLLICNSNIKNEILNSLKLTTEEKEIITNDHATLEIPRELQEEFSN